MRNIMIKIEYDGTNYNGWQIQPNGITIQGEIKKALKKLTGEDLNINGSGRTDAKVHARGQVANFYTASNIPVGGFARAINHFLPQDIAVLEAKEVSKDFHARYWAEGKMYGYQLYIYPQRSPLLRNHSYHITYELDIAKIEEAVKLFIGTHDFKAFMSSGSSVKSTIRTIKHIKLERQGHCIWLEFEGNGFLYNMVRIIVGTLVEIGSGKRDLEIVKKALETGDRRNAGHLAPPQGLFLEKVFYPLTH
ncbi:tRNA pseudouridine38-40 synthase [Natronincola peptidivorans]|uniref:tRNA pseudouridine synthase A n=1 Tax=Natronincola peptidivorans TaxID=426128 RepID=A0A1I0FEB7_9FIRM|nr:tRNA pseudouridine(38-40) synthase TruA [Natronincola peptidivorans]SET56620.1 tRNA pseudouridine38-40 synthase [Natronincola peptidivorans]